jgi:hypothetical protein
MVDRPKSTALKHPKAWLSRRQGKTQALQRVQGKVKSFNPGAGCHDGGQHGAATQRDCFTPINSQLPTVLQCSIMNNEDI